MFKKLSAVLLSAAILCCSVCVFANAKTSEEADTHLQYGEDGKFRIMQISDMQDYFPMKLVTKKTLKKVLADYPVDLIVLTGDNIASTTLVKPYAWLAMHEFLPIFERLGTPVVMVFGNHDDFVHFNR